ncbi:MAG: hypothetical protein ACM3JB_00240 [Acidobacteriaceae bacterium]
MSNHPAFQTEIEFELPKGYLDDSGTLHRRGTMRLATAADEILPLRDPRVQQNEAYLAVIVLARVITRLGTLSDVHTGIVEGLYASDLAYLQRLYDKFNGVEDEAEFPTEKHSARGNEMAERFAARGVA